MRGIILCRNSVYSVAIAAGLAVVGVACSSSTPSSPTTGPPNAGADDDIDISITEITFHDEGCEDGIKTDGCPKDYRFDVHFENSSDDEHDRFVTFEKTGVGFVGRAPSGGVHGCFKYGPSSYGCHLRMSGNSSTHTSVRYDLIDPGERAEFKTCLYFNEDDYEKPGAKGHGCRTRGHTY
jgi:hypothetical protein